MSKLLSLTQPRVQYLFRSNSGFYAGPKDYKVILSNLYRLGMLYAKIINYCIFNIHQQKELLQDNLLRLLRLLSEHDFNLLGAIKL